VRSAKVVLLYSVSPCTAGEFAVFYALYIVSPLYSLAFFAYSLLTTLAAQFSLASPPLEFFPFFYFPFLHCNQSRDASTVFTLRSSEARI
jgi:hypothetical protein